MPPKSMNAPKSVILTTSPLTICPGSIWENTFFLASTALSSYTFLLDRIKLFCWLSRVRILSSIFEPTSKSVSLVRSCEEGTKPLTPEISTKIPPLTIPAIVPRIVSSAAFAFSSSFQAYAKSTLLRERRNFPSSSSSLMIKNSYSLPFSNFSSTFSSLSTASLVGTTAIVFAPISTITP